jgi:hypothetical protein
VDTIYYKPIKKFVGNAWWGIGEVALTENYQRSVIPENGISKSCHLTPFRHIQTPPGCVDFIDDNGHLWSDTQKVLVGNIFISYDKLGVIRGISKEAGMLHIDNVSVIGLETLPEGCSVGGTWVFDGDQVFQQPLFMAPKEPNPEIEALKKEIAELRELVIGNRFG